MQRSPNFIWCRIFCSGLECYSEVHIFFKRLWNSRLRPEGTRRWDSRNSLGRSLKCWVYGGDFMHIRCTFLSERLRESRLLATFLKRNKHFRVQICRAEQLLWNQGEGHSNWHISGTNQDIERETNKVCGGSHWLNNLAPAEIHSPFNWLSVGKGNWIGSPACMNGGRWEYLYDKQTSHQVCYGRLLQVSWLSIDQNKIMPPFKLGWEATLIDSEMG